MNAKIKNNKIFVNGESVELTSKQLSDLGIKRRTPFERADDGEPFYVITYKGEVDCCLETFRKTYEDLSKIGNYCTDKELTEQRALHETLDRLLWRFSCEHGGLITDYYSHFIVFNAKTKKAYVSHMPVSGEKILGTPTFPNRSTAERAITEVIEPFMEEHPDFIW